MMPVRGPLQFVIFDPAPTKFVCVKLTDLGTRDTPCEAIKGNWYLVDGVKDLSDRRNTYVWE